MKTIVTISIPQNIVADIKTECIGCPISQKYARMFTGMIVGRTIDEMKSILHRPTPLNPCAGIFRKSAMYAIQNCVPKPPPVAGIKDR